jgi:hypothetical protein
MSDLQTPSTEVPPLSSASNQESRGTRSSVACQATSRPLRARLWGVVRVALLAGAVSSAGLAVRIHAAHAALGSTVSSALGAVVLGSEQLLSPSSPTQGHGVSSLLLNGARVRVQSSHETRSSSELHSDFKKECPSATFFRGSAFNMAAPRDGTHHNFTGACLWLKPGMPADSALDLIRTATSGGFSSEGSATILFARDLESGREGASQALRLEVPIQALTNAFPAEGDAPGTDPAFVVRPAGTRVLSVVLRPDERSARATAPQELVFVYESPGAPGETLNAYADTIVRSDPSLKEMARGTLARTFRDARGYFSVVAAAGPKGTILTIVRL